MFKLTGEPEQASAQLIEILRARGVWPEDTMEQRLAQFERDLQELRNDLDKVLTKSRQSLTKSDKV